MSYNNRRLQRSFAGGEVSEYMYSRVDDARVQNGAAKILNMVCKPQGSVMRRPGTQIVRATRDSDATSRLLPFKFSADQSVVVEVSRNDSEALGHFRFHVDGATLLYAVPDIYRGPQAATPSAGLLNDFATGSAHGFTTGEPIVFTIYPNDPSSATMTSMPSLGETVDQTFVISWGASGAGMGTSASEHIPQQFCLKADTAGTPGELPEGIEEERLYWTKSSTLLTGTWGGTCTVEYTFSRTYKGDAVKGVNAAATLTNPIRVAAMPPANDGLPFAANTVYYAVEEVSPTRFRVARTVSAALEDDYITFDYDGGVDLRVHYGYRQGDLVDGVGGGSGTGDYYCMRTPWCSAPLPYGFNYAFLNDHLGHATTTADFWYEMPTSVLSVSTVNTTLDSLGFGAAHGLEEGDPVILSGTAAPGGLTFGTVYYVREFGVNAISLSATPYGAVIDITTTGAAVIVRGNPIYEVPHSYAEDELFRLATTQSNDVLTIVSQDHPVSELRRLSASRWELIEVQFGDQVPPPEQPFLIEYFKGEGYTITGVQTSPTPSEFITDGNIADFLFPGDSIVIEGITENGLGGLFGDGLYTLYQLGGSNNLFAIRRFSTGETLNFTGTWTTNGTVRFLPDVNQTEEVYVVTSVTDDGEESVASNELTVECRLSINGARNTIGWGAVFGAVRYRIYKKVNNVFGFIGSSETTQFEDENLGPDESITPPIRDDSLRRESQVTFDSTNDVVMWEGHDLPNGTPVSFRTNGDMPGVEPWQTYYVTDASENSFALLEDPADAATVNITGTDSGEHFGVGGAFPAAVAYFEQRRVFAGGRVRPQDVWMTSSGTETALTYSIPIVDSDRIYFRIAARESAQIRHLVPLSQLILMSDVAELRVSPLNDDALTPTSISIRPQSFVGCDYPQPALVNNTVVFAAARGGHLRELGYSRDSFGYLTGDLSLRAQHLFDGLAVVDLAYQKAPIPMIWAVSTSGKLLSLTYIPEEGVGAWSQHVTDGTFESVVSIPEGLEDAVYVVVLRNGVRYVERFAKQFTGRLAPASDITDAVHVDASITYDGAATTTVRGLSHLEGLTVSYLADGRSGETLVSGGQVTLPTAASKVTVGLPFTSQIDTVPLHYEADGFGSGKTKNITDVFARVFESGAFQAGPLGSALVRASDQVAAGSLLTGIQEMPLPGCWDLDGQVTIVQDDPLPLTIVGLTLEFSTGN